jgi:hypothetical protein
MIPANEKGCVIRTLIAITTVRVFHRPAATEVIAECRSAAPERGGEAPPYPGYFWLSWKRLLTSAQFTTFHHSFR